MGASKLLDLEKDPRVCKDCGVNQISTRSGCLDCDTDKVEVDNECVLCNEFSTIFTQSNQDNFQILLNE